MDWLTKMNTAINYIENNLTDDIDFNIVARKACCSSYNFQRMFSFITDIPLAEYIIFQGFDIHAKKVLC